MNLISDILLSAGAFAAAIYCYVLSGRLKKFTALESHGYKIVMDPERRFGKPIIEEIGFEAETLVDAVRIEKTISRAARLYRVDEMAVKAALDFHKLLQTPYKPKPPEPLAA